MKTVSTMILIWLALQLPLGIFIGACIKLGATQPQPARRGAGGRIFIPARVRA
jgi:hypothetical protein